MELPSIIGSRRHTFDAAEPSDGKSRIELEDFSGKTAKAVKQDFHAKIFLLTLSAAYAHPIEERVKEEYKADENRKYDQKINRTNSNAKIRDIIVALFIKRQYQKPIESFDKIVYSTREIIRPNRKKERTHRQKKPYSMNSARYGHVGHLLRLRAEGLGRRSFENTEYLV